MYTLIKKNIIPIMVVVAIILIIPKSYIRNVLTSLYYNKENFKSKTEHKNEEWFMENNIKGVRLLGYPSEPERCQYRFSTLEEAKQACNKNKDCTMITMDAGKCHPNKKYELRKGETNSFKGNKTWFKPTNNTASTTKPTIEYFNNTSTKIVEGMTSGTVNNLQTATDKVETVASKVDAAASLVEAEIGNAKKNTISKNKDTHKKNAPLSGDGTKAITSMINTFTPFLEKLMDKDLKNTPTKSSVKNANPNTLLLSQLTDFFNKRDQQYTIRQSLMDTEASYANSRHSNHAIDQMLNKQTKLLRKLQKEQASLTKQYKNKKKELIKNSAVIDNSYILRNKVPACPAPINMNNYTLKTNILPGDYSSTK